MLKNFQTFTGKYLCQSLFLSCNFINKETLAQQFSCEGFSRYFFATFKTFFTEHLWVTASILQQFLPLYFAIIYTCTFQIVKSHQQGKKFIHISYRFSQIEISFTQICFFIFFDKCFFTLSITQSVCCTLRSLPFCWLGDT